MVVRALSQDVLTAETFEKAPQDIAVFCSIDNALLPCEQLNRMWIFSEDELRFTIELKTIVTFESTMEKIQRVLVLDVGSSEPASWELLYQMRICIGKDINTNYVADQFNADFVPGSRPITVEVADENVSVVRIEMRTIHRIYWPHPKFTEGDMTLFFKNDPPLRTWRALLALASPYMAERLIDSPYDDLNLGDFCRFDMEQLLLQLYPTNWPIFINFEPLARAAVGFNVPFLLYKLNKYLVEYNKMPVNKKWKIAKNFELDMALQVLVQRDVSSGDWDRRIAFGFEPEAFFSSSIYRALVCPAILSGRGVLPPIHLTDPWTPPHYFSAGPYTVALVFRRTSFHVNRGLLAAHGVLIPPDSKVFQLKFSSEMEFVCAKEEVIPGKVLVSLLNSMHPGGPDVESCYLKAALIFCFDHGWKSAQNRLEQRLLLCLNVTSQQYLEHLQFAERFGLDNMLRALIHQMETCCEKNARWLSKKEVSGISEKTRRLLKERLADRWNNDDACNKNWAVEASMTPTMRQRVVGLERTELGQKEENLSEVLLDAKAVF